MASRYLITGVQLGMIEALMEQDPKAAKKELKKIQDKQFVGNTLNEISEDVLVIREGKLPLFTTPR
jgi:hypothetical protein